MQKIMQIFWELIECNFCTITLKEQNEPWPYPTLMLLQKLQYPHPHQNWLSTPKVKEDRIYLAKMTDHQIFKVLSTAWTTELVMTMLKMSHIRARQRSDTCYSAAYMSQTQHQQHLTIAEVAADWQELMVLQRIVQPSTACANGQLELWCSCNQHTTTLTSHTRPSSHSVGLSTQIRLATCK